MGGFDALYQKAVANSKAEEEKRKPKVTTTERDSSGNKVTVTKDAPTKKEFYAEVARRQVATGQGIGGKDNLAYTNTSEGHKIAVAAEKQGLHVGNVRKESTKKAEIENQARNELLAEKASANGPLTAGQRNPDGSRVTSARGQRPQEPTQAEIDRKSAEIANRGGVNRHVVDYFNSQVQAQNAQAQQSQTVVQATTVVGRPPAGYDQLNEQQKNTYNNLKSGSPATADYFLQQATAPKTEQIKASRGALGPTLQAELDSVLAANPGYKYAGSFTVDPNTGQRSYSLYNIEQAHVYHDSLLQYKKDLYNARLENQKIEANTKADNAKLRDIADRSGYALNQTVTVGADGSKTTQNEFIEKPQVPANERYGIAWIDATGKTEEQVKAERDQVKAEANASGYIVNENKLSNGSFVIEKIPKGPEAEGPPTIQGFGEVLYRGFVGSGTEMVAGFGDLFTYIPGAPKEQIQKKAQQIREFGHVDKEPIVGALSAGVLTAQAASGDKDAAKELERQKQRLINSPTARAEFVVATGFDLIGLGGPAAIKGGVIAAKEGAEVVAKFATKAGERAAVKNVEQAGKLAGVVGSEGLKNPEVIRLGSSGQPIKSVVGVPFEEKAFNIGGKTLKINVPAKTKLYEVVENQKGGNMLDIPSKEIIPHEKGGVIQGIKGSKLAEDELTKSTAGFYNPATGDVKVARQATTVKEKLASVGQDAGYGSKVVEGSVEVGKPAVQPNLIEGEVGSSFGKVRDVTGGSYAKSSTTYVKSNRPKISETQAKAYAEKGGSTVEDISLGVPKTEDVPYGMRGFGKDINQSFGSDIQQARVNRSVPQSGKAEQIRGQAVEQSMPYVPKINSATQAAEYTRYVEESPEIRMKIQKQERLMGSAKKDLEKVNSDISNAGEEVSRLDNQFASAQFAGEDAVGVGDKLDNARQKLNGLQAKKQDLEEKIANARAKAPITREDVLSAIQRGQTKARDVEGKDVPFFEKDYPEKKIAAPGLIVQPERFAQKFEVLTYEKAALNKAAKEEAQAAAKSTQSADLQKSLLGDQKTVKRISKVGKSEDILKEPTFDRPLEQNLSFSRNKSLLEEKPSASKRAASEESRSKSIAESLSESAVEGKGFKLIGPQSVGSVGVLGLHGSSKKVRVEDETTYVRYPGEKLAPKLLAGTKLELITKPGSGQGIQGDFKIPSSLKTVPGFGEDSKTIPGSKPGQGNDQGLLTVPGTGHIFDTGQSHDGGTIRVPRVDVPTIPKIPGPIEVTIPVPKIPAPDWPGGGLKVGHGGSGSDSAVGLKQHDVTNILFPALSIGKGIPKVDIDKLLGIPKKGKKKGGLW